MKIFFIKFLLNIACEIFELPDRRISSFEEAKWRNGIKQCFNALEFMKK